MSKLGSYSKEIVLARPDGRNREGRLLKQIRFNFTKQLGGEEKVTSAQRILIERGAMLQLQCAKLDKKFLAGMSFTQSDDKIYIALNDELINTLISLDFCREKRVIFADIIRAARKPVERPKAVPARILPPGRLALIGANRSGPLLAFSAPVAPPRFRVVS